MFRSSTSHLEELFNNERQNLSSFRYSFDPGINSPVTGYDNIDSTSENYVYIVSAVFRTNQTGIIRIADYYSTEY